jgi:hypothetical protein
MTVKEIPIRGQVVMSRAIPTRRLAVITKIVPIRGQWRWQGCEREHGVRTAHGVPCT